MKISKDLRPLHAMMNMSAFYDYIRRDLGLQSHKKTFRVIVAMDLLLIFRLNIYCYIS